MAENESQAEPTSSDDLCVVMFVDAEGRNGIWQADSLETASRYVETLRNEHDARSVKVFRLNEIEIDLRVEHRVILSDANYV